MADMAIVVVMASVCGVVDERCIKSNIRITNLIRASKKERHGAPVKEKSSYFS